MEEIKEWPVGTEGGADKMKFYLCGSITGLKDGGESWRAQEMAWGTPMGYHYHNPSDQEIIWARRFGVRREELLAGCRATPYDTRKELFKEIIHFDLKTISECNAVIAYVTKCSWGTASEITWAFMLQIPVHIVLAPGAELKPWPEACAVSVHTSFENLHEYLERTYAVY